jgi:helicase MOV-10
MRRRRTFPIIFHALVGQDEREKSSPSWFNVPEVKLVGAYVNALLDMRSNRPAPQDIGVITPYRKQVPGLTCYSRKDCAGQVAAGL